MSCYIYSGPGVSIVSVKALRRIFPASELLSPREVCDGSWRRSASLFVMPGGRDLPYCKSLDGDGSAQIRDFVHHGGRYLGVCAGAYFASNTLSFAEKTPQEVSGERPLKFFSGCAKGPLVPYTYESDAGAACVALSGGYSSFYNGGCFFEGVCDEILASYLPSMKKAVIACCVGLGRAVLSGVHFEITAGDVDSLTAPQGLADALLTHDKERRTLGELIVCALQLSSSTQKNYFDVLTHSPFQSAGGACSR